MDCSFRFKRCEALSWVLVSWGLASVQYWCAPLQRLQIGQLHESLKVARVALSLVELEDLQELGPFWMAPLVADDLELLGSGQEFKCSPSAEVVCMDCLIQGLLHVHYGEEGSIGVVICH